MFDGSNFKRWQKKVHFMHMTLSVVYVLTTSYMEEKLDEMLEEACKGMKWEYDDYIGKGHILNDSLLYVYSNRETGQKLWNSLEAKISTGCNKHEMSGQSVCAL